MGKNFKINSADFKRLIQESHKFASTPDFDYRPDLVQVSSGFAQDQSGYISNCILPPVEVNTCKFSYYQFDKKVGMQSNINADAVGKSQIHEVPKLKATIVTKEIEDLGLDVAYEECDTAAIRDAARTGVPANLEVEETTRLTSLVLLQKELRMLAMVLDESKYTANTNDAGDIEDSSKGNLIDLSENDQQFNGTDPMDPLDFLSSVISTLPYRVTAMAANQKIMGYLRTHPAFLSSTSTTVTTQNQGIANILGLDTICEARAWQSDAAGALTKMWGNYILLFAKSQQLTTESKIPTYGFTAKIPEEGSLENMYVTNLFEPKNGLKGTTYLRVGEQIKQVVNDYSLAILIKNPLTA